MVPSLKNQRPPCRCLETYRHRQNKAIAKFEKKSVSRKSAWCRPRKRPGRPGRSTLGRQLLHLFGIQQPHSLAWHRVPQLARLAQLPHANHRTAKDFGRLSCGNKRAIFGRQSHASIIPMPSTDSRAGRRASVGEGAPRSSLPPRVIVFASQLHQQLLAFFQQPVDVACELVLHSADRAFPPIRTMLDPGQVVTRQRQHLHRLFPRGG